MIVCILFVKFYSNFLVSNKEKEVRKRKKLEKQKEPPKKKKKPSIKTTPKSSTRFQIDDNLENKNEPTYGRFLKNS